MTLLCLRTLDYFTHLRPPLFICTFVHGSMSAKGSGLPLGIGHISRALIGARRFRPLTAHELARSIFKLKFLFVMDADILAHLHFQNL